ncbi:UNVERIFIED_ORG: putative ATPase [Rhizobium esperanzae]
MKIDFLHIRSSFKNLEGVRIDFDEDDLMTVVVGRNGSGKSNVLEALVVIFRNLDLGESPAFSYAIRYKLGESNDERWITVDADPRRGSIGKQYQITCGEGAPGDLLAMEKQVPISRVKRNPSGVSYYLPNYLFAYYSGPSDRLEDHFRRHRTEFYRKLLENKVELGGQIRPLFYAKPNHSQFVLLAFFLSTQEDKERKFLRDQLGIEGLDAVHFVMRRPEWVKAHLKTEKFWGAGGVVRDFLDRLYPLALSPLRVTRNETLSLTGRKIKNEFVHLFLPDVESLRAFSSELTPDVFFKMLESTLLSEIIAEVNVRVKVSSSEAPLTFRELSEGEQQLLTVLGLLKFTGGRDSLFLLDEPDTHLNPAWAVKYLEFLREFVPNHEASHLLMVTHHPLAIAELEKDQVQVMTRDAEYRVRAKPPIESPRGMGYAGILTSDMFGLQTTLDLPTEELIRERRALSEKSELSSEDRIRLNAINSELQGLGFSTSHWDTDYQEYLRRRKKIADELFISTKDSALAEVRRRIADEIIQEMLTEENSGPSQ